jgi:hypothetical protein
MAINTTIAAAASNNRLRKSGFSKQTLGKLFKTGGWQQ